MTATPFKLTVHMVASLDGFIAKKDNSVSWFETADHYEKGVKITEQDMLEFAASIGCYVMGARTYEHALGLSKTYGWPYGDVPTIVLSRRDLPIERPNIQLYNGDLHQLVTERLKTNYQNVWLVGGAMLVKEFVRLNLADEIRLSILPILLGDGLPFFDHIGLEQPLHLLNVTAYKSGMVELCYGVKK